MDTKTDRAIAEAAARFNSSPPILASTPQDHRDFLKHFNPQKVTQMLDERDALRERVEFIKSFIGRMSTQHAEVPSGLRDYGSYYYKFVAEAKEVLGE